MSPLDTGSPQLGTSPIGQFCFVTDDLEGAVAAFAKVTGLAPGPISIATNSETPTIYKTDARVVRARTCAFKLPNVDVEFLEPGPEPSVGRDSLNARGSSLHHVAFRCENLEAAQASLSAEVGPVIRAADFVGGGGRYAVFDTTRTIGAMVELFEVRSDND